MTVTQAFKFSDHAVSQMAARDISYENVAQALTDPLATYPTSDGRGTVYEGLDASVAIASDGTIKTVFRRRFIRFA